MRPTRSFRGPTFSVQNVATKMAIAIVALSLLTALAGLQSLLFLYPGQVLGGFVWQPLSYVFLAGDPLGVIFGALITWSMGTALESTWGSRRLLWFSVGTTALSGALTVLLAWMLPSSTLPLLGFSGATVLSSVLWVAFGLSFGRAQTNFWGMPLTGNQLALVGVGFVILNGALPHPNFMSVVPELIALALTWAYVRGASPRLLWLRLQNWRLRSRMRGRSKHLKVISPERNTPGDSDRFLH